MYFRNIILYIHKYPISFLLSYILIKISGWWQSLMFYIYKKNMRLLMRILNVSICQNRYIITGNITYFDNGIFNTRSVDVELNFILSHLTEKNLDNKYSDKSVDLSLFQKFIELVMIFHERKTENVLIITTNMNNKITYNLTKNNITNVVKTDIVMFNSVPLMDF